MPLNHIGSEGSPQNAGRTSLKKLCSNVPPRRMRRGGTFALMRLCKGPIAVCGVNGTTEAVFRSLTPSAPLPMEKVYSLMTSAGMLITP